MKKFHLKPNYFVGAFLILSLCTFTGCSTSATDDITEIDTDSATHIEKEITNGDGNTIAKINADITLIEYDNYSVATTKKYEFNSTNIKTLADSFFDNSKCYKKLNYQEYSIDMLNDELEKSNLSIQDAEQLYNDGLLDYDSYWWADFDKKHYIDELNDLLLTAPREPNNDPVYEIADNSYTYPSYYIDENGDEQVEYITNPDTSCKLEGTYNDTPCTLYFYISPDTIHNESMGVNMDKQDELAWKNYTYNQINLDRDKYKNFASVNPDIDNQCTYSSSQAIDICDEFLASLNISDMAPMDIQNLSVSAYNISTTGIQYGAAIDTGYCGYKIYYGKSINNINTNLSLYATGSFSYMTTPDERNITGHESIIFTVMDSGIISMHYLNPNVVEDITSNNTPILEFDTIMELADSYLLDAFLDEKERSSRVSPFHITKIEFGLARIINVQDDTTYTLVPVWDFYEDNTLGSYDSYPTPVLTINAIDGSRINLFTSQTVK